MNTEQPTPSLAVPGAAPRRWGRSVILACAVAVGVILIVANDHRLRRHENVVATILAHDAPSLLPFSDYLFDRIGRKTEWNDLLRKLHQADVAGDRQGFIKSTYELTKFVSSNLGTSDTRRRAFLLELVRRYGDDPQTIPAYLDLFDADWQGELRGAYPAYIEALIRFANTKPQGASAELLTGVASTLRQRREPELELRVLRRIRETERVNVLTAAMMERLAEMLPENDPDLPKLKNDLAEHSRRQEQLLASSKWYTAFEAARARQDMAELEQLRRASPPAAINAFTASADAHLAQQYLWLGRFADAAKMQLALADGPAPDLSDDSFDPRMLMALMPPGDPTQSTRDLPAMPDLYAVRMQRWRGLLARGQREDAAALAGTMFAEAPELIAAAAIESDVARGDFSNISPAPVARLDSRSSELPDELAGQANVSHATLDLHPAGAAVPAEIRAKAELWVSDQLVVIDFSADEPRTPPPAPKAKARDQEVFKDECVELFFNPDRWFDFYYQIDVNTIGVIYDARMLNAGGTKAAFNGDPRVNLDVKTNSLSRAGGWGLRVVVARTQIFPPGQRVARFNIRRFRYVEVNKQPVLQIYTWANTKDGSHHPEQFGWLILPGAE